MTAEDMRQEIERQPWIPLRLHLASGKTLDVPYPQTIWLQQNAVLIVQFAVTDALTAKFAGCAPPNAGAAAKIETPNKAPTATEVARLPSRIELIFIPFQYSYA